MLVLNFGYLAAPQGYCTRHSVATICFGPRRKHSTPSVLLKSSDLASPGTSAGPSLVVQKRKSEPYFCPACERLHHRLQGALYARRCSPSSGIARCAPAARSSNSSNVCTKISSEGRCQRIVRSTAAAVLDRHLQQCCPDLLGPLSELPVSLTTDEAWSHPSEEQIATARMLLEEARQRELQLRQEALRISFNETNAEGEAIKRDIHEIARRLSLPEDRVETLMRLAMRAIPMPADPEPLQVIHEDDAILVVNKPAALVTAPKHRWMGGTLVNRAITHLGRPPFPIHRLDFDTSGVIVLGKTSESAGYIHKQLRKKTVRKQYLAIVMGRVRQQEVAVDASIGDHPIIFYARSCEETGQPAMTNFRVLARAEVDMSEGVEPSPLSDNLDDSLFRCVSLVAAFPETGRTHQIRLHLAHIGHPILGDALYGAKVPCAQRQMLHASSLSFRHPFDRTSHITYTAPLPDDFLRALDACGLPHSDCVLQCEDVPAVPSSHV